MNLTFVSFSTFFKICSSNEVQEKQSQSVSSQSETSDSAKESVGVFRYNTEQRARSVQNAVNLYTDILRCSLFSYRELIYRIMFSGKNVNPDEITRSDLEKSLLRYFEAKLTKIEHFLKRSEAKKRKRFKEMPFLSNNFGLKFYFESVFSKTPDPLKISLSFQIVILKAVGMTDDAGWLIDEILRSLGLPERTPRFRELVISAMGELDRCFTPILSTFLSNFREKTIQATRNKGDPSTPFDVDNLMACGSDRFDWAKNLIEEFSKVKEESSKNYSRADGPVLKEVREELLDLLDYLARYMKNSCSNSLFETYLNENNLNEENQQIFKECQKILTLIFTKIVNHTLNYYEKEGTLLTLPK